MPAHFASCPCCGMTVPFSALNFEPDGQRVSEPVLYGTFVKTRYSGGGYKGLRWESGAMPLHMLAGLREQLVAALAVVDREMQNEHSLSES